MNPVLCGNAPLSSPKKNKMKKKTTNKKPNQKMGEKKGGAPNSIKGWRRKKRR